MTTQTHRAETIRQPAVAGMFYSSHASALDREVSLLLEAAHPPAQIGSLLGLIVPHAGYTYSGATAAHAFGLLHGTSFSTIVIVAPSHREYFSGISVYSGKAFRTPLGDIPVNAEMREKLVTGDPIIESSVRGHGPEHAIEVQLPFIQKVAPQVSILPIVIGEQSRRFCLHLGERLAGVAGGDGVLLVASSDLSHYHPYDDATKLDRIVADQIVRFDEMKLMDDIEHERCEACGGGPIVSVMIAAKKLGANCTAILHQCNSGDVTGDRSAVVGYLSAAILRRS
jgi:MEMO1 family protein